MVDSPPPGTRTREEWPNARPIDVGTMNESQYMLCSLDGQQYGNNGAYLSESHSYYDRNPANNPYVYATQLPEASLPRQHSTQHPHHLHQQQQQPLCRLQQPGYDLASDARLELISAEPPATSVVPPPSSGGGGIYYDGSSESCSRPYHSVYYAGAQEDLGSVREGFHQGVLSSTRRGPMPSMCYSSYYPMETETMDGIGLLGGNPGIVSGHSMSGYCTSASTAPSSLVPGNELDPCSFEHQQTTQPQQTTFKWLTVRRSHPKTAAGIRGFSR